MHDSQFDPRAYTALQIELDPRDRCNMEAIAAALNRIADAILVLAKVDSPPKAHSLNPTVTEIPRP